MPRSNKTAIGSQHNALAWACVFILAFGSLFSVTGSAGGSTSVWVNLSFIDVGQGDAIYFKDSTGFDLLVDGGKRSAGPVLLSFIQSQNAGPLDVMIATHPDEDHLGGLVHLIDSSLPVGEIFYNGYAGSSKTWSDFNSAISRRGISLQTIHFPGELNWGALHFTVLHPPSGLLDPDPNDACLVFLVQVGKIRFLLTGDIDTGVEKTMLAQGTPLAAHILKVAHHGSKASSSDAFLAAVAAINGSHKEAILSVGPNGYGHPAAETLTRLAVAGFNSWRTDGFGTIQIGTNGETYTIAGSRHQISLPLILQEITRWR